MNVFWHNDALHINPETDDEKQALQTLLRSVQAWFSSHRSLDPIPACVMESVGAGSIPGLSPVEENAPAEPAPTC